MTSGCGVKSIEPGVSMDRNVSQQGKETSIWQYKNLRTEFCEPDKLLQEPTQKNLSHT